MRVPSTRAGFEPAHSVPDVFGRQMTPAHAGGDEQRAPSVGAAASAAVSNCTGRDTVRMCTAHYSKLYVRRLYWNRTSKSSG